MLTIKLLGQLDLLDLMKTMPPLTVFAHPMVLFELKSLQSDQVCLDQISRESDLSHPTTVVQSLCCSAYLFSAKRCTTHCLAITNRIYLIDLKFAIGSCKITDITDPKSAGGQRWSILADLRLTFARFLAFILPDCGMPFNLAT